MKPLRRLGGVVVLAALGLTLLPTPSQARLLEFVDPAGDATGVGGLETTPRPNDPEVDLVVVGFATKHNRLVLTSQVAKFGVPVGSVRSSYFWRFTYNRVDYVVSVSMHSQSAQAVTEERVTFHRRGSDGTNTRLECESCELAHDPSASAVRAVLPLDSMSAAMRRTDPAQPELRTGSVFRDLSASSDRGVLIHAGDDAAPKPGTVFLL